MSKASDEKEALLKLVPDKLNVRAGKDGEELRIKIALDMKQANRTLNNTVVTALKRHYKILP